MSEEPVPYEPIDLNEEALKQRMGNAEKLRIDVLTGRKAERERAEMLRIEALRAAAMYLATRSSPHSPLDYAEHFRHWLETGEDTLTAPRQK